MWSGQWSLRVAPLSYWGGVRGKNAMRYLGGWFGGSWLDRMMSDIGNGIFDAAWLVGNFDNLNPANTFWTKQYNVWVNPEKEKDRYLQFEKWWGDFVLLRGEEMQWMVDNLFIGNKFSTGQIVTRTAFASTSERSRRRSSASARTATTSRPRSRLLDWILDNYQSVEEIQQCGQRIFYCIDAQAGHLAIFVGTKVAEKNHAEFINNMELIEAMPPGLYEIVITEKPGAEASTEGECFRSLHRGAQPRRHSRTGLQLARGRARVCSCRTRFRTQQCPLSELRSALDQDDQRPATRARSY